MTLIKYLLDLLGLLFCAELFYIAFAYTNSLFISTKKEYNKNSKYFRGLLYSGSWEMIYFSGSRPHVTGKEKLPKDSRFVIVCNHRSNFDPVITWYALRKYDLAYISKPENFKVFTYGKIIRRCCFIPLIRGNPRLAIPVFDRAVNLINDNQVSIGIYPEGTRSKTCELLPFHNGVFKIAQRAQVPVVVACIQGTEKIHKNFPFKKTPVQLDILDVIPTEKVLSQRTCELGDYCRTLMENHLAGKKSS